ncbi:hypothetical protein [Paraburkholderia dipogonis]|uniref:hypothetical protein n=1 Tax=Paraburkholderia dipogonis TaxID=1211383 RepID=UPI0038B89D7C
MPDVNEKKRAKVAPSPQSTDDNDAEAQSLQRQLLMHVEIASDRAYRLRLIALVIGGLAILIGAVMTFAGLQGSFNWAVGVPKTIEAKLTNAAPGIVFATAGLIICVAVVLTKTAKLLVQTSKNRVLKIVLDHILPGL